MSASSCDYDDNNFCKRCGCHRNVEALNCYPLLLPAFAGHDRSAPFNHGESAQASAERAAYGPRWSRRTKEQS